MIASIAYNWATPPILKACVHLNALLRRCMQQASAPSMSIATSRMSGEPNGRAAGALLAAFLLAAGSALAADAVFWEPLAATAALAAAGGLAAVAALPRSLGAGSTLDSIAMSKMLKLAPAMGGALLLELLLLGVPSITLFCDFWVTAAFLAGLTVCWEASSTSVSCMSAPARREITSRIKTGYRERLMCAVQHNKATERRPNSRDLQAIVRS